MSRLPSLAVATLAVALVGISNAPAAAATTSQHFQYEEMTVAQLQAGMTSGKFTSHQLVQAYLARIAELDKKGPALRAVMEINPDALAIADSMDAERKAKGPRGPLHGIPVLIKDNIDTADRMMTTAGSLALVGSKPPKDSFVAQKL